MGKPIFPLLVLLSTAIASYFFFQRKLQAERSILALRGDSIIRMKEAFADFVQNSSLKLDMKSRSFIDNNHDTIANIQQLFKFDKYKLVLFLSDKQCVDCQVNAFKSLEKLANSIDLSKVLIISRYNDFSQVKRLTSGMNIHMEAVNAVNEIFPDYIEKSNSPYFFLLDNNSNILSLMKHDTYMPIITAIYINSLQNCLYNETVSAFH